MTRYLAHIVLILSVLFALSPLASTGFNGFTPAQFPVQQDFWPVQPAGWAFSIWGLIYLWLIVAAGWGLWQRPHDPAWQAMRQPLAISLLIGVFWLAAASAAPVLATVMIVIMAAAAIVALIRAGHEDAIWQSGPVGLYAGWLTAASGVAIGVVLGGYGIMSARLAAWLMIIAVLLVALWVVSRRPGSISYPLAVVWALSGIVAVNWGGSYPGVAMVAGLGILVLAIAVIIQRRQL